MSIEMADAFLDYEDLDPFIDDWWEDETAPLSREPDAPCVCCIEPEPQPADMPAGLILASVEFS